MTRAVCLQLVLKAAFHSRLIQQSYGDGDSEMKLEDLALEQTSKTNLVVVLLKRSL